MASKHIRIHYRGQMKMAKMQPEAIPQFLQDALKGLKVPPHHTTSFTQERAKFEGRTWQEIIISINKLPEVMIYIEE